MQWCDVLTQQAIGFYSCAECRMSVRATDICALDQASYFRARSALTKQSRPGFDPGLSQISIQVFKMIQGVPLSLGSVGGEVDLGDGDEDAEEEGDDEEGGEAEGPGEQGRKGFVFLSIFKWEKRKVRFNPQSCAASRLCGKSVPFLNFAF